MGLLGYILASTEITERTEERELFPDADLGGDDHGR